MDDWKGHQMDSSEFLAEEKNLEFHYHDFSMKNGQKKERLKNNVSKFNKLIIEREKSINTELFEKRSKFQSLTNM